MKRVFSQFSGTIAKPSARRDCAVMPYDRAPVGYADEVAAWLADPHAYFAAFGSDARAFQKTHRSERLRTMTFVALADELAAFRPVCVSVDRVDVRVRSWEEVFSHALTRLAEAQPQVFAALQAAGELAWLGCAADDEPFAAKLAAGDVRPGFETWAAVVSRVQWLFLMCGIRLNEAIVQVDPYTDEEWAVRHAEIRERRAADRAFMDGRRAAQRAWAEAHPGERTDA